jgi:hypothetical protein
LLPLPWSQAVDIDRNENALLAPEMLIMKKRLHPRNAGQKRLKDKNAQRNLRLLMLMCNFILKTSVDCVENSKYIEKTIS